MVENIEKVVVRGEKLQMLQERTEELAASAELFKKQVGMRTHRLPLHAEAAAPTSLVACSIGFWP